MAYFGDPPEQKVAAFSYPGVSARNFNPVEAQKCWAVAIKREKQGRYLHGMLDAHNKLGLDEKWACDVSRRDGLLPDYESLKDVYKTLGWTVDKKSGRVFQPDLDKILKTKKKRSRMMEEDFAADQELEAAQPPQTAASTRSRLPTPFGAPPLSASAPALPSAPRTPAPATPLPGTARAAFFEGAAMEKQGAKAFGEGNRRPAGTPAKLAGAVRGLAAVSPKNGRSLSHGKMPAMDAESKRAANATLLEVQRSIRDLNLLLDASYGPGAGCQGSTKGGRSWCTNASTRNMVANVIRADLRRSGAVPACVM